MQPYMYQTLGRSQVAYCQALAGNNPQLQRSDARWFDRVVVIISKQNGRRWLFGALFDRRLIYSEVRFCPLGIAAARRCKQRCSGSAQ
jgi:hypothetical protein